MAANVVGLAANGVVRYLNHHIVDLLLPATGLQKNIHGEIMTVNDTHSTKATTNHNLELRALRVSLFRHGHDMAIELIYPLALHVLNRPDRYGEKLLLPGTDLQNE